MLRRARFWRTTNIDEIGCRGPAARDRKRTIEGVPTNMKRGICMEHPECASLQESNGLVERDILSLVAMLDYLVVEVGKFDAMSAQCLMLARKSLVESVTDALVKTH